MSMRQTFDGSRHHWDAVRQSVGALSASLASDHIDPLVLGKSYAAVAAAISDAVRAESAPSPRFDAAALALDLRTKRTALEDFLGGKGRSAG